MTNESSNNSFSTIIDMNNMPRSSSNSTTCSIKKFTITHVPHNNINNSSGSNNSNNSSSNGSTDSVVDEITFSSFITKLLHSELSIDKAVEISKNIRIPDVKICLNNEHYKNIFEELSEKFGKQQVIKKIIQECCKCCKSIEEEYKYFDVVIQFAIHKMLTDLLVFDVEDYLQITDNDFQTYLYKTFEY